VIPKANTSFGHLSFQFSVANGWNKLISLTPTAFRQITCVVLLPLDDYACLWEGCEFLAMGSPRELEIHAHFHTFHSKLKFIGEQMLKSHPNFPSCTQDLHSNNLVPEISEGLVCQWEHCDSTFNNPEWFYRHVDMHAHCTGLSPLPDQQQAIFCSWKGCDAFFKIKYRLREHLRSHTQERLVACPTCGCMFSSNTKFFDHIHRQAEPEGEWAQLCLHCDKGFANERLLRDHVRQHVNHIKCPLCDMTCTSLATLKIHIKFRHCDERPFPCDFCESSFKNQHDLRKHMETHNEGAAYHCSVEGCDYSSRMAHTMNQHYKRVHEVLETVCRGYQCQSLTFSFSNMLLGLWNFDQVTFSWCYTLTLHLRKKHHLKWPSGHSRFRYEQHLIFPLCDYRAKRLSAGEERSAQPSPRGSDSPVYCVLSNVSDMGDDPDATRDGSDSCGPSGAVRALTEVARGLGMDVV
uniref:Zgc:112083 n=1 Tax=Oncorhynchus kisutch TaxID=8019 RepID=A0A8C7HQE5_ONCKI